MGPAKRRKVEEGTGPDTDGAPAAAADDQKATKRAPVLPWMRLPTTIEAGGGVLLEDVVGLDRRLVQSLKDGEAARPDCRTSTQGL
jgi:hypothetical protein